MTPGSHLACVMTKTIKMPYSKENVPETLLITQACERNIEPRDGIETPDETIVSIRLEVF